MYNAPNTFLNIILYIKENNDVNLHGHVSLNKEAAELLSKSINTVGNNIVLGATIAGISTAVGKTIAKSSLPPVQKAAIVIGGGLMGGLIHSGISQINRANAIQETVKNSSKSTSKFVKDVISKLLDDSSDSPLEGLLSSIQGINSICITILVVLIIQLFIRLHVKDTINIYFLNPTINKYLGKLVALNKKVSVV
jgi:hypothetical protein